MLRKFHGLIKQILALSSAVPAHYIVSLKYSENVKLKYVFTGTYEKIEEEEEEIYEVINVHKLKSATPNLRVINLYGINFVDDSHIDAFSSNCIQV